MPSGAARLVPTPCRKALRRPHEGATRSLHSVAVLVPACGWGRGPHLVVEVVEQGLIDGG